MTAKRTRKPPRSLVDLIESIEKYATAGLDDEEAVHDLRVACRRLEAGTRLYTGMLSRKKLRGMREAAKTIRRAFDQARDLEVIAAEIKRAPGLSNAFREGLAAAGAHTEAGETALASLDEPLEKLADAKKALSDADEIAPADLLARLESHTAAFFDELARLLPESTDDGLHELRIDAKKLRYEIEILRPTYPRLATPVKRIKRLQDILGRHQDAVVGLHWAEALQPEQYGATEADRAALMRYYAALHRQQRRQLRRLVSGWWSRDIRHTFLPAAA